jgi:hypothetical protein
MALLRLQFPDAPRWVQTVQLEGDIYTLSADYNVRADTWTMDIATADGETIVQGIRLVLNWPLLRAVDYDDRLPPGEFSVLDPTGRATEDPGRFSFRDDGYVLTYQESSSA